MSAPLLRDLFLRTAIHLAVASIFLAPLAMVELGAPLGTGGDRAEQLEPAEAPAELRTVGFRPLPRPSRAPADEAPLPGAAPAEAAPVARSTPIVTHGESADRRPEPTAPASGDEGDQGGVGDLASADMGPQGAAAARGDGNGRARSGAARAARARKKACEKPHPHVRRGADGVTEIDRALVDHYTADLESFMELGYSRPYDEGDLHGWYVSGFSCTSPVSKAGFQRGDVLLSVNGKKTRSWVGVFMLYQKLKKKDEFVVELVRDGAPVTLTFRVVDGGAFAEG